MKKLIVAISLVMVLFLSGCMGAPSQRAINGATSAAMSIGN